MSQDDPHPIYEQRRDAHRATAAEATKHVDRFADLRLLAFLALLGALGAALFAGWTAHLIWLPLAAFVWLVTLQGRAANRRVRAQRAAAFHEAGLRRLDGTWPGTGRDGAGYAPEGHLYADDLDLFGAGSLFELLCTARTSVGERRLADWLLAPAAAPEVRSRQGAVRELAGRLDFREALAVEESRSGRPASHALP